VSNAYRDVLAEYGLRLSGQSPDGGLVEVIELPDHPWSSLPVPSRAQVRGDPPPPLFSGFHRRRLKKKRAGRPAASGEAGRERLAESPDCDLVVRQVPLLIAGPCVIEAGDVLPESPPSWRGWRNAFDLPVCFKASFDKANRSGPGRRGVRGWRRGCGCWNGCGPPQGCRCSPTSTEAGQAAAAAQVVDALQIPASSAPEPTCCSPRAAPQAGEHQEGPVDVGRGDGGRGGEVREGGGRDLAVTSAGPSSATAISW